MRNLELAFIDIETTGLNPYTHEIIEIGIVVAAQKIGEGGRRTIEKISEHRIQLHAEHIETADSAALKINGYRNRDWSAAVPQIEGLTQAVKILQDKVIIAQNVGFDWAFLQKCGHDRGINFDQHVHYHKLDLASMVFGKHFHNDAFAKFTLREMAERFDVKNLDAHTALSDARTAFEICQKLLAP